MPKLNFYSIQLTKFLLLSKQISNCTTSNCIVLLFFLYINITNIVLMIIIVVEFEY